MIRTSTLKSFLTVCTLLLACRATNAQLATSFYNITGIHSKQLANAVQVTITTDGVVQYGFDSADFLSNGQPIPTTTVKMRVVGARMGVPALVEIGSYPVDAAQIAVAQDALRAPYGVSGKKPTTPAVDVTLRFYVPITMKRFDVGSYVSPTMSMLQPLQVEISRGQDRRSIVITVFTDRADPGLLDRMQRSPADSHTHRLSIQRVAADSPASLYAHRHAFQTTLRTVADMGEYRRDTPGDPPASSAHPVKIRIDALHTPLVDVLHELAAVLPDITISADRDTADLDISLFLPAATIADLCRALETGYGVTTSPYDTAEGVGYHLSRTGVADVESIPLHHLVADKARLLFPDFLLPSMRVDAEHNVIIASGSPLMVARMRKDLSMLDQPTPQVRVDAKVWEFTSSADKNYALNIARAANPDSETINGDTGQMVLGITSDEQKSLTATLTSLESKGRVHLVSSPSVVVKSGSQGNLFIGDAHYLQVLQHTWLGLIPNAIQVPIGTTLTVRPLVGDSDLVTLGITPGVSSIESINTATGLPVIETFSANSTLRLHAHDTVILGGLDLDIKQRTNNDLGGLARLPVIGPLFRGRHSDRQHTQTLILVSAETI